MAYVGTAQPKVLVLGGGGMLGHKLVQHLRSEGLAVTATFRRYTERLRASGIYAGVEIEDDVDVWRLNSVERALARSQPTWVVNCVGIIKQLKEANDPAQVIYVNAVFPHLLARVAHRVGARVIHISTDCVFSGRRGMYSEADASDAEDLYGRTKYLGELGGPGCLTIRTSIIGRDLHSDVSLVDWFLSQRGRQVRGYARAIYSGLTTAALSRQLIRVMTSYPQLEGLYHVSSSPIDKYTLLQLLNKAFNANVTIHRDETFILDRSMVSTRYWQATAGAPPTWEDMIRELAADPTDYDGFRAAGEGG